MINVCNLDLLQVTVGGESRSLVLLNVCGWTPEKHDLSDGEPSPEGKLWFRVIDQAVLSVAGFGRRTANGDGYIIVTCDPNRSVAPIHPKAMISILHAGNYLLSVGRSCGDVVAFERLDPIVEMMRGP